MSTGPNQILLKRSDTVSSVPSGLSFGEPAINTANGKLFFQEQIDGTVTGRMLSFHGFTNESFVTNVNGSTGSIAVVNSLNGLTGTAVIKAGTNITLTTGVGGITVDAFGAGSNVTSFNGVTGAVEGVGSFNGATGAVVTDTLILPCAGISLNAGGITFPDGTQQNTAFRAGLKYTVQHTDVTDGNPTAGGCKIVSNLSGSIDIIVIHDTDGNGNDISSLLSLLADNGGFIQFLKEDGSELVAIAVLPSESPVFANDVFSLTDVSGVEVDTTPSEGDIVYVYVVPNTLTAVETFGGNNIWNKGNISVQKGLTVENVGNNGYLGIDNRAIEFESYASGGRVKGITFDDGTHQSTAAGLTHTDENFTDADHTKLNGIEASADVTDAANVTSAGALMDSELTSIADVKALDQSVVSGANPVFTFISALAGISVGAGGVTFSDGTQTTTALRTDSYTGQIETAADKTYTLDPKVATARTITGFYIKSASGTVTATLKNGSDTIKAASVSDSSGDQSSLGNTSVSADAVLTMVTSSNSSALDVIFNVEYTAAL